MQSIFTSLFFHHSDPGNLAEGFSALMRAVQNDGDVLLMLKKFKECLDKTTDKFVGYDTEHDAQEFLITLRDALNGKF